MGPQIVLSSNSYNERHPCLVPDLTEFHHYDVGCSFLLGNRSSHFWYPAKFTIVQLHLQCTLLTHANNISPQAYAIYLWGSVFIFSFLVFPNGLLCNSRAFQKP